MTVPLRIFRVIFPKQSFAFVKCFSRFLNCRICFNCLFLMGFLFFSNSLKLTNVGRENTVSLFAECWEKSFVDLFLLKFFILQ